MPDYVQRNFRVAELGRIFRSRYLGGALPDDDAGWGDLKELLLAHASTHHCTREHLEKIALDWAAHFNGDGVHQIIDKVLSTPLRFRRRKAETVGKSLQLRFEERERLGVRTIRSIDKTQTEIKAIRLQRKLDWQIANRRAAGVVERTAYLAQFVNSINKAKPWEAERISESTWWRRRRKQRAAQAKEAMPEQLTRPSSLTPGLKTHSKSRGM